MSYSGIISFGKLLYVEGGGKSSSGGTIRQEMKCTRHSLKSLSATGNIIADDKGGGGKSGRSPGYKAC